MLTPLVMLPGLICDSALWRFQIEEMADVAAVTVADLTLDDSVKAMAVRTLAVAPAQFALAAMSMGGYVAFEIMRQAPERVTRLALFSTSAAPDSPEKVKARQGAIASVRLGQFRGATERLLPSLVARRHIGDSVAEIVKDMAARVGANAFLTQQQAILGRPDSRAVLSTIKVPTLVAVGDCDVLTPPSDVEDIHRGIAGSRFHIFRECGHLPALECPDETTRLLRDWLSS
jgi:pimeloyl-ACP methyl ester carboxylesterase